MARYTKRGMKRMFKTARRMGSSIGSQRRVGQKFKGMRGPTAMAKRVRRIESMIETKEGSWKTAANVGMHHNLTHLVQNSAGTPFNVFQLNTGPADPMGPNNGNRVGDKISVKGVMLRGFFENALARSKVYYRVMVIKGAKGDFPAVAADMRTALFKGDSDNKMIDQVNTERYTIVAQKTFNISPANAVAVSAALVTGEPVLGAPGYGGQATRTFKMWIPGSKFGKMGSLIYENASNTQVKFYDYRVIIVCYDWFGTPQDVNIVGRINEMYSKVYFKDA